MTTVPKRARRVIHAALPAAVAWLPTAGVSPTGANASAVQVIVDAEGRGTAAWRAAGGVYAASVAKATRSYEQAMRKR